MSDESTAPNNASGRQHRDAEPKPAARLLVLEDDPRTNDSWRPPSGWGARKDGQAAAPAPQRIADDTPFPPVLMDWPLVRTEPTEVLVKADLGMQVCPDCRTPLRVLAGKGYCLKCGFSSDAPRESGKPKPPSLLVITGAFAVLLSGSAFIVAASIYRQDFLDAGTTTRVWWIALEAAFGFLLYWVGHFLAVYLTFRDWAEADAGQHLDPTKVWRYALAHLPRTQLAVYAGFWGVTAMMTAFILFCLNDYSAEDRTTRPPKYGSVVGKAGRGGDANDYGYSAPPSGSSSPSSRKRKGPAAADDDSSSPSDAPKLRLADRTTECVVIGYIPDAENPGHVAQIVLGTRDADGKIRYAGASGQFAEGTGQITASRFRRLAQRPDYLPAGGNIIPVEPTRAARVSYAEADDLGHLKDVTINELFDAKE